MSREVEQLAILSGREAQMVRLRQRKIFFGAIAVVLLAILFFYAGSSEKPGIEKPATINEPENMKQAVVAAVPLKSQAELAKEKAELAKAQAAQAKLEAAQAKARAKAEREAKLKAEQEARLKAAQEARAKAEQDKLLAAQARAQVKAEREAKLKAEQEARLKAAQEAKAKAEQDKLLAAQARAQAKAEREAKRQQALVMSQQAKAQTGSPSPADKSRAPLELDIPKNMPAVNMDVYVVVKGDTLWSISQRFTGDPFNYPRIAGENKIANPDLIFPDQRIKLIK